MDVLESFGKESPSQLHTPAAVALRDLLTQAQRKLQGYSKRQTWLQKAQPWKLEEEKVCIGSRFRALPQTGVAVCVCPPPCMA